MTKTELLALADTLDNFDVVSPLKSGSLGAAYEAADALREYAATLGQEPVAVVRKHTGSLKDMAIIIWIGEQPPEGTKLYTHPSTNT